MATETSQDGVRPAQRWMSALLTGVFRATEAAGWALVAVSAATFAGASWWVFDLAANFRPHLAMALGVVSGVAAFGRRLPSLRRSSVAFGVAAAVNGAVVLPYLVGFTVPVPEGAPSIEVVSFNVGISTPERDRVVAWIAEEDPDVVFLYESSFEWEDAVRDAGLGLEIVAVVPPDRIAGITVLARSDLRPLLVPGNPFDVSQGTALRLDVDGTAVEILGLHPLSPTSADRSAARDALLASAGDWVAGRDVPVLVVGDLNSTPWSHAHRSLVRRGGLTDSLRGRGLQGTWPAGLGPLMIPIDHALHTDGLVVVDRRTGPSFGSAHRSLAVTVTTGYGP